MNLDEKVSSVRTQLLDRYETLENKADILKASELKELFALIPTLPADKRGNAGQKINELANELKDKVASESRVAENLSPIDVTAPIDTNSQLPMLLGSENGSIHPVMQRNSRDE